MIIGNYIRMLLEDGKRVILAGFGNLEIKQSEGPEPPSGKRINPPGTKVRFDTGFSKDDGVLAATLAAGEGLSSDEAQQRVLELVDAIKFTLDKGEEYLLPDAGSFSRNADGKISFQADPDWVIEPDQFGLESMDLLELEELSEEIPEEEKEATASASALTPLATPVPRQKGRKWLAIWLVVAALMVTLMVVLMIPAQEGEKDGLRRPLFNRNADKEVLAPDQNTPEQEQTEASIQDVETETESVVSEPEVPEALPVEVTHKFFIIAGSFQKLKNASDLQDQLIARGFQAEVMLTENRMYRVSIASYATKEEAEKGLYQITSEPGLNSCWLLSN
jgi:nucleoid DNA-binding protein/cell division septation protein DedD